MSIDDIIKLVLLFIVAPTVVLIAIDKVVNSLFNKFDPDYEEWDLTPEEWLPFEDR